MTKVALTLLVVVALASCTVQGSTLNENKKGELKRQQLEGDVGLNYDCPSRCDYCSNDYCYYYDSDLAAGWIIAIAIICFLIFFVCIPVGICFCCGYLCFSGCRKRDEPQTRIVYVQGPPPAGWGQQQPGTGQHQQYGYPPPYPHQQQYGQKANP